MNEKDVIIMEFLDEIHPFAAPKVVIHYNLAENPDQYDVERRISGGMWSENTTANRLARLEEQGMIEIVREKGNYRKITDQGRNFLRDD